MILVAQFFEIDDNGPTVFALRKPQFWQSSYFQQHFFLPISATLGLVSGFCNFATISASKKLVSPKFFAFSFFGQHLLTFLSLLQIEHQSERVRVHDALRLSWQYNYLCLCFTSFIYWRSYKRSSF